MNAWACSTMFQAFRDPSSMIAALAALVSAADTPPPAVVASMQLHGKCSADDIERLCECVAAVDAHWSLLEAVLKPALDGAAWLGAAQDVLWTETSTLLCAAHGCLAERMRLPPELRSERGATTAVPPGYAAFAGMPAWRFARLLGASRLWGSLPSELIAKICAMASDTREHLLHCALAEKTDWRERGAVDAIVLRKNVKTCLAIFLDAHAMQRRGALSPALNNLRAHARSAEEHGARAQRGSPEKCDVRRARTAAQHAGRVRPGYLPCHRDARRRAREASRRSHGHLEARASHRPVCRRRLRAARVRALT